MVAAIGCAFAGMCYSEFATMIPIAGSAYTYAYATMGELMAWIIGWDLVLEYAAGAATVSVSWSKYLVRLLGTFGVSIPPAFYQNRRSTWARPPEADDHDRLRSSGAGGLSSDGPGSRQPCARHGVQFPGDPDVFILSTEAKIVNNTMFSYTKRDTFNSDGYSEIIEPVVVHQQRQREFIVTKPFVTNLHSAVSA